MRLIDADALADTLFEKRKNYPAWVAETIGGMPFVDVVSVVRCGDCIHYRYYGLSDETVSECTINHCENPDGNWFCADGEVKDNV